MEFEGWLIKSPPTKSIWRARWRRRWFALKQGELPGQYLLEYYTDETCRKLKGAIDLDQCEQVDAGLFMEHKYQFVFNVKTPRRTYYLAAASDDIMRYWVNCICNVCGLQDLSKMPTETADDPPRSPVEPVPTSSVSSVLAQPSYLNIDAENGEDRTYQNNDFVQSALSDSLKFNTMQKPTRQDHSQEQSLRFMTLPPAQRRTVVDDSQERGTTTAPKPPRPIPEKLKLTDIMSTTDPGEPSPALSTASGPYIPISECYSGKPMRSSASCYENNFAPLNSLSRGRLDNVRSPLNIGHLNLTEGPPPQSPKSTGGQGGRSSDDSESVFTDDDELASSHSGSHVGGIAEAQLRRPIGSLDRRLRPSDSSIENENIGWTAVQRYSKVPNDEKKCLNSSDPPPRPPKRLNEGTMGPLDSSSCVAEERYEIPRSHRNPNCTTIEEPQTPLTESQTESKPRRRSHFYTNAAPSNLEGQVFRYDFAESHQEAPPVINRNLKPKAPNVSSKSCDQIETPPPMTGGGGQTPRLPTGGVNGRFPRNDEERSIPIVPRPPVPFLTHSDDKLQYLDLDHSSTAHAPLPSSSSTSSRPESMRSVGSVSSHNIHAGIGAGQPLSMFLSGGSGIKHSNSEHSTLPSGASSSSGRGIVYKTVDFVKTEAFNRTRQDAENNRNLKEK